MRLRRSQGSPLNILSDGKIFIFYFKNNKVYNNKNIINKIETL